MKTSLIPKALSEKENEEVGRKTAFLLLTTAMLAVLSIPAFAQNKNNLTVVLKEDSYTYTGEEIKADIKRVEYEDGTSIYSEDYNVSYDPASPVGSKDGDVTVTVTVKLTHDVTYVTKKDASYDTTDDWGEATYTIKREDRTSKDKSLLISGLNDTPYTGKAIEPVITVKDANGDVLSDSADYVVKYENNTSVGTATVKIEGKGDKYAGFTGTGSFQITTVDLSKATVTGTGLNAGSGISYSPDENKRIIPDLAVEINGNTLKEGTDYSVSYVDENGIGNAVLTITGKNNYSGTITKTYKITPKNIAACDVSYISDKTYTGSEIKPSVRVTDDGYKLTKKDYKIKYEDNVEVGDAKVVLTGKNNYTGEAEYFFTIKSESSSSTSSSSTSSSSSTVTPEQMQMMNGNYPPNNMGNEQNGAYNDPNAQTPPIEQAPATADHSTIPYTAGLACLFACCIFIAIRDALAKAKR